MNGEIKEADKVVMEGKKKTTDEELSKLRDSEKKEDVLLTEVVK